MTPIQRAVEICGGPSKTAQLLGGVSAQAVCFWRDGKRRLPVEVCAVLEEATGFQVRRWDLRPDDWWRVWPELRNAVGAPPLPESAKPPEGASSPSRVANTAEEHASAQDQLDEQAGERFTAEALGVDQRHRDREVDELTIARRVRGRFACGGRERLTRTRER